MLVNSHVTVSTQISLLSEQSPEELMAHRTESWLVKEVSLKGVILVMDHFLVHGSHPLGSLRN